MKTFFLPLVLAAQMMAVGAIAQTDDATNDSTALGAGSGTYGSDWSSTLGPAIFGDDGTTLRPDAEIAMQWNTLSDEDKLMIRRDCAAHLEKKGGMDNITEGAGTKTAPADEGTTGTMAADGSAVAPDGTTTGSGSSTMISVTDEQMETICAVTKDL